MFITLNERNKMFYQIKIGFFCCVLLLSVLRRALSLYKYACGAYKHFPHYYQWRATNNNFRWFYSVFSLSADSNLYIIGLQSLHEFNLLRILLMACEVHTVLSVIHLIYWNKIRSMLMQALTLWLILDQAPSCDIFFQLQSLSAARWRLIEGNPYS